MSNTSPLAIFRVNETIHDDDDDDSPLEFVMLRRCRIYSAPSKTSGGGSEASSSSCCDLFSFVFNGSRLVQVASGLFASAMWSRIRSGGYEVKTSINPMQRGYTDCAPNHLEPNFLMSFVSSIASFVLAP
jgi:hypothetical protein